MRTRSRCFTVSLLAASWLLRPSAAVAQPVAGQVDTFENGTTQNWAVALGPVGGTHPAPPENVAGGGPAGAGDNYLRLTAIGGGGPGSRLSVINLFGPWSGNYLASGITAIRMDLNNLGTTDLSLRLMFEDPVPNPPANIALSTDSIFLPAGGGWTSVIFPIDPGSLKAALGTVNGALSNTTAIRIYHNPTAAAEAVPVIALLGVDNITAAAAVPEPSTAILIGLGGLAGLLRRRGKIR